MKHVQKRLLFLLIAGFSYKDANAIGRVDRPLNLVGSTINLNGNTKVTGNFEVTGSSSAGFLSTLTVTGPANINNTGNGVTNIGTVSTSGVNIANGGTVGAYPVNIGAGASTGAIAIGNTTSSTTTILGSVLNLNNSATASTINIATGAAVCDLNIATDTSNTGTIDIGNTSSSTLTLLGSTLNINNSDTVNSITNIATGAATDSKVYIGTHGSNTSGTVTIGSANLANTSLFGSELQLNHSAGGVTRIGTESTGGVHIASGGTAGIYPVNIGAGASTGTITLGNSNDGGNQSKMVMTLSSGLINFMVGDGSTSAAEFQKFKINGQDIYQVSNTISSSLKYKTNINDLNNSEDVYKLRPVSFEYKNKLGEVQYGFIIEEMIKAEIFKDAILNDKDGIPDSLRINLLLVAAVKALQELKKSTDSVEAELRAEINQLKEVIKKYLLVN